MKDALQQYYGYLFEDELLEEIQEFGTFKEVKEGDILIEIGEYIKFMPLLISGAIKILREDQEGDELILYFIERGDTCTMTLSCCMEQKKSEIRAVAETDAQLIMIPVQKMGEWMTKYKSWQNFILQSYNERMTELLEAIDAIAFLKMDKRVLKYLKDKAMANHDDLINVTHREIANDMHTSRVVISRLLKSLEKEGHIKLHRNSIKVLDL
ncbi:MULTISPECIES: Crp/Fnr family transcriptional regulator [Mangrovimonas]|uniref:Crp/Fnr family transcriptional regulator n=1 Tax=Mangrovimonas TaxID=1211036 RepID=UPI0006B43D0B|nr:MULTISPECIES: Crp/Fnr family transcriptional regulator [Mangrovimonas]OMP30550.1 Crp/Fnr family transcriptional regulator [Mangrovimonas sp. DI 80]